MPWVTSSKLKNRKFYFELLTRQVSSSFFTFEIVTRSWKKTLHLVTNLKNERTKSWIRSPLRFLYWNEISYNSELFEKNIGMLDFVILDIDLAFKRYCLWSWDYSAHALRDDNDKQYMRKTGSCFLVKLFLKKRWFKLLSLNFFYNWIAILLLTL